MPQKSPNPLAPLSPSTEASEDELTERSGIMGRPRSDTPIVQEPPNLHDRGDSPAPPITPPSSTEEQESVTIAQLQHLVKQFSEMSSMVGPWSCGYHACLLPLIPSPIPHPFPSLPIVVLVNP